MIKNFFTTKNLNLVALEDCTIYLNVKPISIGTVYIFPNYPIQEYTTVGSAWKNRKSIYSQHKGYLSTERNSNYLWNSLGNYDIEEIAIIGYEGAYRYHLLDISIGKRKNVMGSQTYYVASFNFHDVKKYKIK
ncbi:hypothetical protein [Priestia megaterium]|uniref:hypothetical protein n=1 Tax=Priestia megaterium TaxID=1404 RepID=UPI000EFA0D70|nr:hypothetical protein [Priestia megaterium]RMA90897.1 hypothetical protein DEU44_2984 [Priestia megaterium]